MADALPSHVAAHLYDNPLLDSWVATDTETSGLFADDGARVSTASVAWVDYGGGWREFAERFDNVTYGEEHIADDFYVDIVSIAWPFDQGTEGKPEDNGQIKLWADAENLPEAEWRLLLEFLGMHNLIMHNGPFDLEKYRVGVRRWPGVGKELVDRLVWDTQNGVHLLYPQMRTPEGQPTTSLKPSCAFLFGKQWADEAGVVKKYLQKSKLPAGRWDLMPWSAIGKYADTDARITLMLQLRQAYDIEHKNVATWLGSPDDVYEMLDRRLAQSKVLYAMTRRGVPYDEVTSREAAGECGVRAERVAEELPFEPPTPDKAREFFFTDKGLDLVPYSVTDKGAASLTAEIVGRMVADDVPHAKDYAEYRKVTTAQSMWYEGYADKIGPDGRLRCAFRQNGTRSSRVSVERINLQAIPQDYRLSDFTILDGILTPRQIIAGAVPDGWRLFELDLAQAELRVATMFAGCTLMEEMIREGEDLHTFTTKALFPSVPEDDPLFKSKWRQVGKRGNFSLCFGSGGPTFKGMVSKETGIVLSVTEAERIVRDWNALYPEFNRAIRNHMHVVDKRMSRHKHGWLDYANKERRWFAPFEETHKAFNQRVQGNLAQFGIDWMLLSEEFLTDQRQLISRSRKDDVGEVGLVLTIHDSQVLLLPDDDYGRNLADQCAQFGKDLWARTFPGIPGDVDYHAWDKSTLQEPHMGSYSPVGQLRHGKLKKP